MKFPITIQLMFLVTLTITSLTQLEGSFATDVVSHIESTHAKHQLHKNNFICSSTGGGGDGKRYNILSMRFNTREPLTIEKGRKYIVESALSYLHEINSHSNHKNCFAIWPFTQKQVIYTISVVSSNGLWVKFPNGPTIEKHISYVELNRGNIYYEVHIDPKKLPETIHQETWDEAIEILKSQGWTEPVNQNGDRA